MAFDIRKLNPTKIREQGKILQSTKQGQGVIGSPIFEVKGGQLLDTGQKFDPNIPNQQFTFHFNPERGLRSTRSGSFDTRSFFDAFPEQEREQARIATSNFGEGTGVFRDRRDGETLRDFLEAKQRAGIGNIVLPPRTPEQLPEAPSVGTRPGQRIPGENELQALREQGIKEVDLARTTDGGIFRRDLAAEQGALGDFAKQFGAPSTPEQWAKFHDFVYLGQGRSADAVKTRDDLITSETLSAGKGVELPKVSSIKYTPQATVDSAKQEQKAIDAYVANLTSTQSDAENQQSELLGRLSDLAGERGGREQTLAQEEENEGVQELRKQLININNELGIKVAAFQKLYADIEAKPISMQTIIGQQAQARAVAQADIGFLQARAQALQNNITFAQETAERSVEQKYAPIDEEIEIKLTQLELLQPLLEKDERVLAEARKQLWQDQRDAVNERKQEENAIQLIAINAIQSGVIDQNIISRIQRAENEVEANLIAQQNLPINTTSVGTSFSSTERKKLEQAGLLNAPRQEQLDFLFGEDDEPEINEFEAARNFLAAIPTASEAEKRSALLENTDLNVSEVNALIDEQIQLLKPKTLEDFATQFKIILQAQKDWGLSRSEAEDKVKAQYGEEFDTLPSSIKKAMEDAVVEVYGRTAWQNIKNFFIGAY